MMKRLAAVAGRPLTYTHPQLGRGASVATARQANEEPGVNIKAQLLPRPVGMMLGLRSALSRSA